MKTIHVSGSNISVCNNVVIVNGKRIDLNSEQDKEITIIIDGNVETLDVDACNTVEVRGVVTNIKTVSGDVHCHDVSGCISTVSGDVEASVVAGSISTISGDVN